MTERIRPPTPRTLLTAGFGSLVVATVLFFSGQPTMHVDGRRIAGDVPVVTAERAVYLPLRAVAAGLGAVTTYDRKNGTIEIIRGADTVRIRVGARDGTRDGRGFALTRAPFVMRGRVMVPSDLFETALGSAVRFDHAREHIDVLTGRGGVAAHPTAKRADAMPAARGDK